MHELLSIPDKSSLDLALSGNDAIEEAEAFGLQKQLAGELPIIEIPLTHQFAPGIYLREVLMPAGTFVVGHEHRTEHFNIISEGSASVMMDGVLHYVSAPCTIISTPGVRKVLFIHEDCRWATVHANPDDERDLAKLEERHIIKSQAFRKYAADLELLKVALLTEQNSPTEKSP